MIKSIFNCDTLTPDYGLIAIDRFAHAMTLLSEERITNGLADYVDTAQSCLIVLCKDLEENLDTKDCLSIIHNVYMFVASHDKKYYKAIGDIIENIARKEKESNE